MISNTLCVEIFPPPNSHSTCKTPFAHPSNPFLHHSPPTKTATPTQTPATQHYSPHQHTQTLATPATTAPKRLLNGYKTATRQHGPPSKKTFQTPLNTKIIHYRHQNSAIVRQPRKTSLPLHRNSTQEHLDILRNQSNNTQPADGRAKQGAQPSAPPVCFCLLDAHVAPQAFLYFSICTFIESTQSATACSKVSACLAMKRSLPGTHRRNSAILLL